MNPLISESAGFAEVRRLTALLPAELRSYVLIVRSTNVNPDLITTKQTSQQQFAIEIDLVLWQQLSSNQRDLLFWHEVARIQGKAISQPSWEFIVLGIGLIFALTEFVSQNILALSITLAVTGLSGYRLYQRNRGEHSFRELAAADQGAIKLAVQFGYSIVEAYSSLYDALKVLSKTARRGLWKKYQVRLRVLEIAKSDVEKASQIEEFELNVPLLF